MNKTMDEFPFGIFPAKNSTKKLMQFELFLASDLFNSCITNIYLLEIQQLYRDFMAKTFLIILTKKNNPNLLLY